MTTTFSSTQRNSSSNSSSSSSNRSSPAAGVRAPGYGGGEIATNSRRQIKGGGAATCDTYTPLDLPYHIFFFRLGEPPPPAALDWERA